MIKPSSLKDKSLIILVAIFSAIAYYYSSIYIPYYCFSFDNILIDIDKYPELWKWSPSILTLIASLIILLLAHIFTDFVKKIFDTKEKSKQKIEINKYILFSLSILGGISIVLVPYLISLFFFKETISSGANDFEMWYLPAIITTCLIYPIAEEIFFRKGIFNQLYSKLNLITSIGLSSILFACIHYPDYRQMITTFIGGILLGMLYEKTNKLVYPVVFHISWNTTVVILNFIPIS